ncbi:hypothetical protein OZY43_05935 [Lactobacillus sp. ESL0785]|uniref:GH39 family glycosyl hydrolase n=1 Tax=Lactobacillus sp. ESL0785 TaxID=2983232 RepID=UPI0023F88A0A|nr:cellulase family glycosylhydrolase [Lactobacillus sp. ESL0785]WEV70481.1 hypothetical protein OZY43_05935 [Lactobacillus sp. ESL0785]
MINFKVNSKEQRSFPHYWELCVGSSHAYTALRADYQKQLEKAHRELGFKYVRFHGIFDDEMSICTEMTGFDGISHGMIYNFENIDTIFDFLLSIGMKPFVELGFMPECLASSKGKIFPYGGNNSMPKSDEKWQELISKFIKHVLKRYGTEEVESWFFEIWNEPNLPLFFAGNKNDYFHLYEITVRAIKAINGNLKVGGPATSFNSWIPEMIDFCEENAVPLDFISTHHYPTDDPLWKSGMDIEEYFSKTHGGDAKYPRGVLKEMTQKTKQQAKNYPLYYTEWNVSAMLGDSIHDEPYASAMIAKTLADNDGLVDGYSFWTFSDIFEEQFQKPNVFHGGFGLQTYQGIAKPAYRIFELFHQLGNIRLQVTSSQPEATAEMLAVKKNGAVQLIIYNHNVPTEEISDLEILIDIEKDYNQKVSSIRIDDDHANAKGYWQEIGVPEYLTLSQIKELDEASSLKVEKLNCENGKIKTVIPANGCMFITIENYFD